MGNGNDLKALSEILYHQDTTDTKDFFEEKIKKRSLSDWLITFSQAHLEIYKIIGPNQFNITEHFSIPVNLISLGVLKTKVIS